MNCSEHVIELPAGGPVRLAGALDIYSASELRDALAAALRERAELTVDLTAVASCDFTTIQLLCSARRDAERAGKTFAVTALSKGVIESCAALGIHRDAISTGDE